MGLKIDFHCGVFVVSFVYGLRDYGVNYKTSLSFEGLSTATAW